MGKVRAAIASNIPAAVCFSLFAASSLLLLFNNSDDQPPRAAPSAIGKTVTADQLRHGNKQPAAQTQALSPDSP